MAAVSGDLRRLVLVMLGGAFVAAAALALVLLLNQGLSLAGCTAATPFGWIVPLVSVVVIGAAAWVLLAQAEKRPEDAARFASIACPTCGRLMLAEWRMCPYCGRAPSERDDAASTISG